MQIRDALKWKFLAKAEKNETLGQRPNTEPIIIYYILFNNYLTLNIFNILADTILIKHNLT